MGFETEPLRFERQGTSAGERVVKRGQLVAIENLPGARMVRVRGTSPPPALPDLGPRPLQHLLVGGVLPEDQLFQNLEQALALDLRRHRLEGQLRLGERGIIQLPGRQHPLRLMFGQPLLQHSLRGALLLCVGKQHVDVLGRVVDHLGEDDRPRRRQRPSCPPQMQGARVTVADRLLPRRRLVDGIQRQCDFDQLS